MERPFTPPVEENTFTAVNALDLAVQAGNAKAANSVMLGAFCKVLGLDKEKFSAALLSCIPQKTVELNKKAFESGYNAVK